MNLSQMKAFDTDQYEYDTAHRELAAFEQAQPCTCQRKARERLIKIYPNMVGYPSLIEPEDADPDCELHFPWMIEDEVERKHAMRWWMVGYQVGYDTGYSTGRMATYEEFGVIPSDE